MIERVQTKKQLKEFVYFIKELYKDHPYYVFPIFRVLYKELQEEVLEKEDYTALLCKHKNKVVGRVLFTYDESKRKGKDICYFSMFDAYNDKEIAVELFDVIEQDMKKRDYDYIEGTFTPYDPDTRRGILVKGFDSDPIILCSYNEPYYKDLLEHVGFKKAIDTVLLNAEVSERSRKRLNTVSKYFSRSHNVCVDPLNYNDMDKDMKDVHSILELATNEIIYQDAPSIDIIRSAAKSLKPFINPKLIRIAREKETKKPIGFCLVLPDFNQVLKKTKGKIQPLRMLWYKRGITRARGMMQYIVPEYQNTGLIGHIFKKIFDELKAMGITHFEAGTMMEDNPKPINAFKKFGGEIQKIYRLYGKDITS